MASNRPAAATEPATVEALNVNGLERVFIAEKVKGR
jgi:hypothetical protein